MTIPIDPSAPEPPRHRPRLAPPALALLLAGCALFGPGPPSYPAFTTPSGVIVQDLVVPTGSELPFVRGGERLTIHYEIRLPGGEVLDSSLDRAEPLRFVLGAGEVPPGLDEGLVGMRERGRRQLTLDGALAFGPEGPPPDLPGNDRFVFEVELLEVEGGRLPREIDPAAEPSWWGE